MATFLVRALGLSGPVPDRFGDDAHSIHQVSINLLAAHGITKGCDAHRSQRYCPDDSVTRAEISSFLMRALDLSGPVADRFGDDGHSVHQEAINLLAAAGITKGCDPDLPERFCPEDSVTRGESAAFLRRALDR